MSEPTPEQPEPNRLDDDVVERAAAESPGARSHGDTALVEDTVIENPAEDAPEDVRVAELLESEEHVPIAVLADAVGRQEAADAADTLETLEESHAADVLEEMEDASAAEALAEMAPALAVGVLEDLIAADVNYAGRLLALMSPDDAVDLLQELDETKRESALGKMGRGDALRLRGLLHYDEESAGGLMTTEFLAVGENDTVARAIERIRESDVPDDLSMTAFVVNEQGRLRGHLSLRRLLLARRDELVNELCDREVDAAPPTLDREDLAREFERYDYVVLPIVDTTDRLIGVVTVDDVIDSIRAEGTEDAQLMVGAGAEEAVWSTTAEKLRGRVPWLMVNLFTSAIAAIVVLQFENLIAEIAILAVLMPVIANQAGNAGQQSLAVTLRGIVLDQVRPHQAGGIVARETLVGLINGTIAGTVVGSTVAIVELVTQDASWRLGIVAGVSMAIALTVGTLTGSGLPLLMKRFGADPATASTIFLTMVTDSMSFFVFLGLASVLQSWVM